MIRTATLKDIPALLNLEYSVFKIEDAFTYSTFRHAIQNDKCYFRVFEDSKIIIGYIYVLITGRIYSIAANPNLGVGSLLLERAEEFVRVILNKKHIKLEVKKGNNKAINFYIKHGYIPYGLRHNYYKDGKAAILMKKELVNDAKGRLA